MSDRRLLLGLVVGGLLTLSSGALFAQAGEPATGAAESAADQRELEAIRDELDATSESAIRDLRISNETADKQYDRAAGYAVFRATKAGLLLTGAGGAGVAVNKETDERTYMRMGSGGVGLGAGIQKYRLVVLFETADDLDKFIDGGWDTATSAQAAAGKAGVNAASSFVDGIAVYQLTDKGLMAQADLTGTRFWSSKKLNN